MARSAGAYSAAHEYRLRTVPQGHAPALNLLNQASRIVMSIIGPVLAVEFALDLLGPRRVQAAFSLVAAAGFAAFALSEGSARFVLARLILGVGISASLMAILKANTQWIAPAQVAGMTGLAKVVGSLGGVLATAPVEAVLPMLCWRGVFW